jgi:hypothetical protein
MRKRITTLRPATSHVSSAYRPLRAERRPNESRGSIKEATMRKRTKTPRSNSNSGTHIPLQAETRSMRNESRGRVKTAKMRHRTDLCAADTAPSMFCITPPPVIQDRRAAAAERISAQMSASRSSCVAFPNYFAHVITIGKGQHLLLM